MATGTRTDVQNAPVTSIEGACIELRKLAFEREILRCFDLEGQPVRTLGADVAGAAASMMIEERGRERFGRRDSPRPVRLFPTWSISAAAPVTTRMSANAVSNCPAASASGSRLRG